MKKKRGVVLTLLLCVLVVAGAYTAVSAAAGSGDPLVTLSYLTDKFTPQMEGEMKSLVDAKAQDLTRQFNTALAGAGTSPSAGGQAASVFTLVTLSKGQTLIGDVGCELLLRVGSAACGGSDTVGLVDESDAAVLAGGKALVKNHLYMVTISTRSVTAGSDTVKLLARGPYLITAS